MIFDEANEQHRALRQYYSTRPAMLDQALERASAETAKRSLYEFTQQFWHTVEPVGTPFVGGWHLRVICEHLEAVTRGELEERRGLIINIPPRHCKSTLVSVMWPAWTWVNYPGKQFLCASYAAALATRDSLRCRRVIDSALYQQRWGDVVRLAGDQNTKRRYDTDAGGYRLAASVDGSATGEGGNVIVIDDPIKAEDAESDAMRQACIDWWDGTMATRLNDPRSGCYVVIMQRMHHQDLTGRLLERGGEEWTHLCLPARYESDHPQVSSQDVRTEDGEPLWPERFPETELSRLESEMGAYRAAGQLQQRPAPRAGGMFERGWFEYVDRAPMGGRSVRGWDLAASVTDRSPWTAGVLLTYVQGTYYVEDVRRLRGSPETVVGAVRQTASEDGPGVLVDLPQDPGQAGKFQARWLARQLAGANVRTSLESGSKEQRALAVAAQAEAGNVKLVRGPWVRDFLDELCLFPASDYADQVDALSRAFHRLVRRRHLTVAGPVVVRA